MPRVAPDVNLAISIYKGTSSDTNSTTWVSGATTTVPSVLVISSNLSTIRIMLVGPETEGTRNPILATSLLIRRKFVSTDLHILGSLTLLWSRIDSGCIMTCRRIPMPHLMTCCSTISESTWPFRPLISRAPTATESTPTIDWNLWNRLVEGSLSILSWKKSEFCPIISANSTLSVWSPPSDTCTQGA